MPAVGIGAMVIATEIGVSTLVGGMMFASGALSFVGSVTGNKTLSMLGAVAGLGAGVAGGWEALASEGAGLAETGSEAYINGGGMGGSVADAAAAAPVAGMETAGSNVDALTNLQNAGVSVPSVSGEGMIGTIGNSPVSGVNPLETAGMNTNTIAGVDTNTNQILGMPDGADGFNPGQGYQYQPQAEQTAPTTASADPAANLTPKVEAPGVERMPYQDTPDSVGSANFAKPEKGLIDTAMEKINGVGDWMQKNDKLVSAAGKIMERLDPSDLEEAQKKYMEAKANNDDAQAAYYQAKIAEMNRLAANANARGTNALGAGNAISANGSAYSNNPTRAGNALSFGKA